MPRIVPYYAPIWESIRFDRGLAHAFCFRRWDIARLVLSQGGSMDWEDVYGRTPLSVALIAHHSLESTPETQKEAHRFISGTDIAERLGFTPLHTAILQNSPEELLQYLHVDLTHLNAQDNLGRTPLVLASCHSSDKAARILLECGADPEITDRSKRSPLHFAAQRAPGIVQALMELCDEQRLSRLLEAIDVRGCTVVYFAIEFNQWRILTDLCARGLRVDVKDNLQRTILHYAAWTGEAEVMDVLSQQDLSSVDLGALDSYGRTAEQCFTSLRHDVKTNTTEAFQRLMAAASRS
ncbi:MAG: hypothetical protein M1833_005545 [Piccolia ochrophora]|nr:MAG: hypothetical protein M1833_005545 [Piccolia ochrophora]